MLGFVSRHIGSSKKELKELYKVVNTFTLDKIIPTEINDDFFATKEGQDYINNIPMRRLGLESDLDGILLLLASDASSFMTGSIIPVDGGHLNNPL